MLTWLLTKEAKKFRLVVMIMRKMRNDRQIENQKVQLIEAKEILEKLLEEEKNNMYWEMNGSDKSSYYEVRKQAEQFLKGGIKMKEVTYEDWLRNPTPRMMWVWDFDEGKKQKLKVIYVSKGDTPYPIITISARDTVVEKFLHCAEIVKPRRMTHKELSRWLREKSTREYGYNNNIFIFSNYTYKEDCEDEEIDENIRIRENDGEWHEPFVEV